MKKQVVIQGIDGSYHEIAARNYYRDEEIDIVCVDRFPTVIEAVRSDTARTGLMAIENTIAGSLLQNHELVRTSGLEVIGEYKLRISHCLAALPGTTLENLREIDSHPMALMQCQHFLETLPWVDRVEKDDTAGSARRIREGLLQGCAAICSRRAAEIYGLDILASEIEDDRHNFTRFLVLGDARIHSIDTSVDKVSLVFSLEHSVGTLSQVLSVLSFYEMNLTKLQSFPIVGAQWHYRFYVDFTFSDLVRYRQALGAVTPLTTDLKILGEYFAAEGENC